VAPGSRQTLLRAPRRDFRGYECSSVVRSFASWWRDRFPLGSRRQRSCRPEKCRPRSSVPARNVTPPRTLTKQRLPRAAWAKNVDKMIGYGAPVEEKDRVALIDYLSTHFGPRRSGSAEKTTPADQSGGAGANQTSGAIPSTEEGKALSSQRHLSARARHHSAAD
jgi:hypothetical protein